MKRDIFQAIADPTRRAILVLIATQALTPNALADEFDMTRQAVSKHIKILNECELLEQEKIGREIYYQLKVGGRRFYAMVSPEGQEHWSVQEFTSITPKTNFKLFSAFADKDENLQLPGSDWDLNFSGLNGTTTVDISIYNESRERMEKMIEMGFKEGFTATLNDLENLLPTLNK